MLPRPLRLAAALPLALPLTLTACIGWPSVRSTPRHVDVPIRTFEEEKASDLRQLAEVTLTRSADGQPEALKVAARRERACTRTLHRVVDRTEVEERELTSPASRPIGYVLGGVGASALSGGVVLIATDNAGGNCFACALTAVGALLTCNLVAAVAADVRAIDRSRHVGVLDVSEERPAAPCHGEPLAGASVRVVAVNGAALLEGTTDERGELVARVDLARALELGSSYRVTIGGIDVGAVSIQVSGAYRAP